jgi:hypothetical protein
LNQLDEYQRFVATTKTLEAAQACYSGKITHKRPDYLATCGHPSAVDFTPCAVRNQYDECRDWERLDTAPPALTQEEALNILLSGPGGGAPEKRG